MQSLTAPAERRPITRGAAGSGSRLPVPTLRYAAKIGVPIINKANGPPQGIRHRGQVVRTISGADHVAIAILNPRAVPVSTGLAVTHLRAVGGAHQQTAVAIAIIDELEIRRVARFVNVRSANPPQFNATTGGGDQ